MLTDQVEAIEIVRADEAHLPDILALADSWRLDARNPERAGNEGFLVSDYTLEHYRARLATAEHFWVAVKGTEVLGFVLAYSDQRIEPDEWLNHRIKTTLGAFLVIKQICVSRSSARTGVASRLYHHVLEQWQGTPVIAAVVTEPYNAASTLFHRKLGFEELTRLTPPDGKQRMVWVWRKPRESMLQAQYTVAIDLYKHEDTTNWHKLNNFFYITAGLAAALGFSVSQDKPASGSMESMAHSLAMIITIIGLASSIAFSQMLRFGRRYLDARKRAAMELEEYMAWHGGQRIVGREVAEDGNDWLRRSPTGLIMMLLPVLVALCWAAMLGVLIAN
ncbi:GNAT family N-acetyltransferase [Streptomyces sp. PSKA54]|uniref:GNAT family N-acetyltransferase n=1 Tax=Streptomyces himalayensis subsp. aureolus TaxID=2758039 RepID=A0A7W2HG87_9ACTN|nr:GNAT family N-acetyltransferase [Streptomyces himalayensis]MBA4862697.1 GNAT family N-acetyltransferase [Streptomyces himalayensis subsp. aureolus]